MRDVSRRFAELVAHANRWVTECDWSNDGGRTWQPADVVVEGSKVTAASTAQIRWSCDLTLAGVQPGLDGINAYQTQLRVRHGIDGERLLTLGRYKVTSVGRSSSSRDTIQVRGSSRECYVIGAQFTKTRTFRRQSGRALVSTLIREVLPDAQIAWNLDDQEMPRIVEPRERWSLIDGDRDARSVARALGGRIYTTPEGDWVADRVPTLQDPAVWSADEGEGGVLVSADEDLSDEGVYNVMVVTGQATSGDIPPFRAGIARDLDPDSPTSTLLPIDEGGFGERPRFYTSQLITSSTAAQQAAQAMLAGSLGLRQKVTFAQLHNPALEPGDVGIVSTVDGPRRVILDSVTYSLDGSPLTAETRTTVTNLAGSVGDVSDDDGGS